MSHTTVKNKRNTGSTLFFCRINNWSFLQEDSSLLHHVSGNSVKLLSPYTWDLSSQQAIYYRG